MATPTMMPVPRSRKRPQENNESPPSLRKLRVFNTERSLSISAGAGTTQANEQGKQMPQALMEPYASAIIERTQEDDQDQMTQELKELKGLDTGKSVSAVAGPTQENDPVQKLAHSLTVRDAGNTISVHDSGIIEKIQENDHTPETLTALKPLESGNSVYASFATYQTKENDQMSHALKDGAGNSVYASTATGQTKQNDQMSRAFKEFQVLGTGKSVYAPIATDQTQEDNQMSHALKELQALGTGNSVYASSANDQTEDNDHMSHTLKELQVLGTRNSVYASTANDQTKQNDDMSHTLKELKIDGDGNSVYASTATGQTKQNDQMSHALMGVQVLGAGNSVYASTATDQAKENDQMPHALKGVQVLGAGNSVYASTATDQTKENDEMSHALKELQVLGTGNSIYAPTLLVTDQTKEDDDMSQALMELQNLGTDNSVYASTATDQENENMSHAVKDVRVLGIGNSLSVSTAAKIKQIQENSQDQKMPQSLKEIKILDTGNAVSASAITNRMKHLFPENDVMPCKSARIFACFTLVAEQRSQQMSLEGRESRHSRSAKHVKPLLSLLSALVTVEQTSLGGEVTHSTVYFSGFDCSSTPPPVDSLWGSQVYLEASIDALGRAVDEFHKLRFSDENSAEVSSCLESINSFLKEMESNAGAQMREECSKTMPSQWPSRRFEMAARSYREDFENLLISIQNEPSIRRSLFVEKHLADFLGQAIRFYLRIIFNPVPWKQIPGQKVEQLPSKVSKVQSRISKMLTMELPDGVVAADSAVADGALSSVFSMALRVVNSYFGYEALSSEAYYAPDIPVGFCVSAASQRGPGTRRDHMTADDVAAVVSDIHSAQGFLDAFRACRFLSDLIAFPGVREEIARVGGWEMVESHARKILQYDLVKWCPNDAHLVVLSDADHFFPRLESYKIAMESSIADCEQSLRAMRELFTCGPNHRGNRRMIASVLEEEGSRFVFPTVVSNTK